MKIYASKETKRDVILDLVDNPFEEGAVNLDAVDEQGDLLCTILTISSRGVSFCPVDEDLDIELDDEGKVVIIDEN